MSPHWYLRVSWKAGGFGKDWQCTFCFMTEVSSMDTENPVCLALFNKQASSRIRIYHDNEVCGDLHDLEDKIPKPTQNRRVHFNDPQGELGFISLHNVQEPPIRFCEASEVVNYQIKVSSRFIARIGGEFGNIPMLVRTLNQQIDAFRSKTNDIFLTPFKGITQDGAIEEE